MSCELCGSELEWKPEFKKRVLSLCGDCLDTPQGRACIAIVRRIGQAKVGQFTGQVVLHFGQGRVSHLDVVERQKLKIV